MDFNYITKTYEWNKDNHLDNCYSLRLAHTGTGIGLLL